MKRKLITLALVGLVCVGATGCTTTWEKVKKDMESETKGLHRKVKVIAMDGSVVEEYESKSMLVTDGDGGTITLDFEGKRIVLCNSQVIIEEIK